MLEGAVGSEGVAVERVVYRRKRHRLVTGRRLGPTHQHEVDAVPDVGVFVWLVCAEPEFLYADLTHSGVRNGGPRPAFRVLYQVFAQVVSAVQDGQTVERRHLLEHVLIEVLLEVLLVVVVATGVHHVFVFVELADAVLNGLAVLLLVDRRELRLPVVGRGKVDGVRLATLVRHRLPRDHGGLLLQHGLEHGRAVLAGGIDVPHLLDGVGHLFGLVSVGVGDLVAGSSRRELLHGVALNLGGVVFYRVLGNGVDDGHLGLARGLLGQVLKGCGPRAVLHVINGAGLVWPKLNRLLDDTVGQKLDRNGGRSLAFLIVVVVPGLRYRNVDRVVVIFVLVLVFGLLLGRTGRTGHGHGHGRHGRYRHDGRYGHDGQGRAAQEHVGKVVVLHVYMAA